MLSYSGSRELVREYLALTTWGRLRYRLFRNPLVLFGLGPLHWVLTNRIPPKGTPITDRLSISVWAANAGCAVVFAAFAFWARVPALALAWPARKAAIVAGMLAAAAYSLMAGFAIPAPRTFMMPAAIAAGVPARRHGSPPRVPALAGLPEVVGVWNLNQTVRRFSRARTHAAAAASPSWARA
jgi:fatty acid desaturase